MEEIMPHQQKTSYAVVVISILCTILLAACHCQSIPEYLYFMTITRASDKATDVPNKLTSDLCPTESGLILVFDAQVNVPDVQNYSVATTEKKKHNDEDIQKYIYKLTGSTEIYSEWIYPRTFWEDKLKKAMSFGETNWFSEEYISMLEEKAHSCPDSPINSPANLSDYPVNVLSTAYACSEQNSISIIHFSRQSNTFIYFRDEFLSVYTDSEFSESQFDPAYETKEHFLWRKPGIPGITQEEGLKIAFNVLSALNVDLTLYKSQSCSIITDQIGKNTGWIYTFTRNISGVQSQFEQGWVYVNPKSVPRYVAPWSEEFFRIAVDEDGLAMVWWSGASEITGIPIENAKLLNFDEIHHNIECHLASIYGSHTNGDNNLKIVVSDITLAMSMISIDNAVETGVYVPSWIITFDKYWNNEPDILLGSEQIIINALDGSYIEPRMTVQERERLLRKSDE